MTRLHRHAMAILLALPLAAAAQTTKPGLWEITQKMGGNPKIDAGMAQMQQQMAAMSPEQRKMMQDMMARQGMSMPGAAPGGGMRMQICITPEMAARNDPPPPAEGNCKTQVQKRTPTEMQIAFQCTDPVSSGDGTFRYKGDNSYTSVMNVTTRVDGKDERVKIEGEGRWVGASCGNVKPRP